MKKTLQLIFGVILPITALTPAFRALWHAGLSGIKHYTMTGILGGWLILIVMVTGWQAFSMLAVVVVAGTETLKQLYQFRLTAVLSLLAGFFVGVAVLIITVSYGQCAYVLEDLSGAGKRFYALSLFGLVVPIALAYHLLHQMLLTPLRKK